MFVSGKNIGVDQIAAYSRTSSFFVFQITKCAKNFSPGHAGSQETANCNIEKTNRLWTKSADSVRAFPQRLIRRLFFPTRLTWHQIILDEISTKARFRRSSRKLISVNSVRQFIHTCDEEYKWVSARERVCPIEILPLFRTCEKFSRK